MKTTLAPTSERPGSAAFLCGRSLALFALFWIIIAPARAHGDLDRQIQLVSAELARTPSAVLFLKRGILHHEHEDYSRALADFERAKRLDPSLDAIWFARGRACFQAGQLAPAKDALDVFLRRVPRHAEAHLLRARVLSARGDFPAAIRDFDENLQLAADPLPECFLERAEAIAAAGDKPAAVASLDEGMGRLGAVITLQSAAIALELELHRHDAALARVDRVLSGLDRKESWLLRRGEILESAGRAREAADAYQQALAAIERLPVHHRDARSMRDLQARLRLKLESHAANIEPIPPRS